MEPEGIFLGKELDRKKQCGIIKGRKC